MIEASWTAPSASKTRHALTYIVRLMSNLGESRYAAKLRKQRGEDNDFTIEEQEEARRENLYEYLGWGDERYAMQQVADQIALLRLTVVSALSKDKTEYEPLWRPGMPIAEARSSTREIDPFADDFDPVRLGLV